MPGDRRWGAIHLGQTFLFASEDAQKKFLADPHRYAPILTGYDVVQFFEKKTLVPGNREWACKFNGRTYLFADQQSYDRFYANCEQFDQMANRVHERMAMDANTDGNLRR